MTPGWWCRAACRVAMTSTPRLCRYLGVPGWTRDKTAAAFRQPVSASVLAWRLP